MYKRQVFLVTIIFKLVLRSNKIKALKKERQNLIEKISKSNDRKEIEMTPSYFKKICLSEESQSYKDFIKYLESIQYKESWDKSELTKIIELKNEVINADL